MGQHGQFGPSRICFNYVVHYDDTADDLMAGNSRACGKSLANTDKQRLWGSRWTNFSTTTARGSCNFQYEACAKADRQTWAESAVHILLSVVFFNCFFSHDYIASCAWFRWDNISSQIHFNIAVHYGSTADNLTAGQEWVCTQSLATQISRGHGGRGVQILLL